MEGDNSVQITQLSDGEYHSQPDASARLKSRSPRHMVKEFVDNTTLHGIRYAFMERHFLVRFIWAVLVLTSGAYYLYTVRTAFQKYYDRPVNTVLKHEHVDEMDFPAVTICSRNMFDLSKLLMTDDNPVFKSRGLNITSCAITAGVRGTLPCGLAMLCCCSPRALANVAPEIPNCTSRYKQDLLDAMQQSRHIPDIDSFFRYYGQDISELLGPECYYDWSETDCYDKDFVSTTTQWGKCYTFSSGAYGRKLTVTSSGVSSGLTVILDAQTDEYSYGKFSEGFKVLVHGQGEYIDELEGINVGPGQHVIIALTEKRYKNLEKPYASNCSMKTLKTFSIYTIEGCLYECEAENIIKSCNCRPSDYKGAPDIHNCLKPDEMDCFAKVSASLEEDSCGCEVPCSKITYITDVSYSKFPNRITAQKFIQDGYYDDIEYQRDNLVLLQVGFKSLSYELQEEQPAYDRNSLFGEIGGNMGLFLGCSLLTIFEFLDFLISFLATLKRRYLIHAA